MLGDFQKCLPNQVRDIGVVNLDNSAQVTSKTLIINIITLFKNHKTNKLKKKHHGSVCACIFSLTIFITARLTNVFFNGSVNYLIFV